MIQSNWFKNLCISSYPKTICLVCDIHKFLNRTIRTSSLLAHYSSSLAYPHHILDSPFSLPPLSVANRAFLLCWKKGGPLHTANTQSKLPSLFVNFRIRHILKRKLWFWKICIKSFASIGYFSLYLVGLALPFIRLFTRPLLFEPIFNFFPNLISFWIEIWTA